MWNRSIFSPRETDTVYFNKAKIFLGYVVLIVHVLVSVARATV